MASELQCFSVGELSCCISCGPTPDGSLVVLAKFLKIKAEF